jgi:hypothetical protein
MGRVQVARQVESDHEGMLHDRVCGGTGQYAERARRQIRMGPAGHGAASCTCRALPHGSGGGGRAWAAMSGLAAAVLARVGDDGNGTGREAYGAP